MSWGMEPKYGTKNWQSALVPPTPLLLTYHFNLLLVVVCIVFPQFKFATFTLRVILYKTLKKEGRAFRNIGTIHNSHTVQSALQFFSSYSNVSKLIPLYGIYKHF